MLRCYIEERNDYTMLHDLDNPNQPLKRSTGQAADRTAISEAVRSIVSAMVLSQIEVDQAFTDVMTRVKAVDGEAYARLAHAARLRADFRRSLQRYMTHALIATSLAAQIEDDAVFDQMAGAFCLTAANRDVLIIGKIVIDTFGGEAAPHRILRILELISPL